MERDAESKGAATPAAADAQASSQLAYAALLAVTLFWAGNAIAGKLAVGHISPMLLTAIRWLLASLLMAPFALPHVRREWPLIRRNLPYLVALGAGGFAAFNAVFYLALNYTTAINVTIEQSAMPLFVFAANYVLFRTGVSALQIVGFTLTLVGVVLTVTHGEPARLLELALNRGDVMMMLAVVLYGSYTVALRFKPRLDWRSTIFILSLAAMAMSVPFALVEYALGRTIVPDVQGLTAALYTAVFPSLLAQTLYIKGVELIGPNRANVFINLVPVFGALFAVLLVGEALHAYHVAALALVLGGITLAERGARMRLAR